MHARKKRFNCVIALLFALMIFLSTFCANGFTIARAKDYPFDQTNVLDDLEQSEEFSLILYPWDSTGLVRTAGIINFVEWCYSPFKKGDFAMYIYFYNPQNIKIDVDNPSNKVQMAIDYDKDVITSESVPTNYEGFNLIYCNKSERPNYEGLFYKFRILDHVSDVDGKTIEDRLYTGERRYDISGITLTQENGTVKEYAVGGTYIFTGYAEGYGPNEFSKSTLECKDFRALETISLEVHPTYYRMNQSSKVGYGTDINSVYFSIPNKYLANGSSLQKIKAEWHEYETEPIIITKTQAAYDEYKSILGQNIGYVDSDGKKQSFTDKIKHGFTVPRITAQGTLLAHYYPTGYSFNIKPSELLYDEYTLINKLTWLFYRENFYNEICVTADEMKDYAENYNSSVEKGYLPISKKISADLFKDTLPEERLSVPYIGDDIHHKSVELDANDKFDVLTASDIDIYKQYGLAGLFFPKGEEVKDISPIEYKSIPSYIDSSDDLLSELLFISESDTVKFKEFYNNSVSNEETTVLFRFAQTDYYTRSLYNHNNDSGLTGGRYGVDTRLAFQTFFFDFKIIHLTFMDENETYKVIPVTQDPIDIYKDTTINLEKTPRLDWWERIQKQIEDFFAKLFKTLGAIGVLILGLGGAGIIMAVGYIITRATSKINGVFGIIISVILAVGIIVGLVFYGTWIFNVIANMGGLW